MEKLRCVVERITFQNEENGYTVLKARANGYNERISVVGKFVSVTVGCVLTAQIVGNAPYYTVQFVALRFFSIISHKLLLLLV